MKILLIEDEIPAANRLKKLLLSIDSTIEIIEVCTSIRSSIHWLKNNSAPELIIMDIELSDGRSFSIFENVEITSPIIFVTAYDEFAIKAIKLSALDYLLKPVNKDSLIEAIEKVKKVSAHDQHSYIPSYQDLRKIISELSSLQKPKKLAITTITETIFVDLENIIRLEADSNYTYIFLADKRKLTASKTLKEFEGLLSQSGFFRIHSSHLVNLSFVEKYIKTNGEKILMKDGSLLSVSIKKKKLLLQLLSLS